MNSNAHGPSPIRAVPRQRTIRLFVESWADWDNTQPQNLTSKHIVAGLDPHRFHVTMLCGGTPDPRVALRPNTELIRFRGHGNALRILRKLLLSPPDIYFFPRSEPFGRWFAALRSPLGLRTRIVFHGVLSVHGLKRASQYETDPVWRRNYRRLSRQILNADAVVGNSRHISEEIGTMFGVRVETIHGGVDSSIFFPASNAAENADEPTVLYAGSFQQRKRPGVFMREAAKWPSVRFRMAGDGEERKTCEALARELGCRNIEFLGHLPQAVLANQMRKADLFLFPSVLEGHPQVLGQAAACGLPCIAMNNYRPDYVVHGVTGFLAENDEELAAYLGTLLRDRFRRRAMSEAAVEHSRQYNWDRVTPQWADLFERCAIDARAKAAP